MAHRSKPSGEVRNGVNTRITPSLRQKLDQAASEGGRSVGAEIEMRLENSFRQAPQLNAAADVFGRAGFRYLLENAAGAAFVLNIGDVFLEIATFMKAAGRSERQAREAFRAALDYIAHFHLWSGQEGPPVPLIDPIPDPGTKIKDLPPALVGYMIAEQKVFWNSAWNDEAVSEDTAAGRVVDHWTGDGSQVEQVIDFGPEPSGSEPVRPLSEIMQEGRLVGQAEASRTFKAGPPSWYIALTQAALARSEGAK